MPEIIQVAQVVRDLDASMARYHEHFGMGPWDVYTFAPPTLRESTYLGKPSDHTYLLALTRAGAVQMELIQPLTGHSMYDDFLAVHGEGIHHVKFLETDCQGALARYHSQGFEVVQSGKFDEDEFYYLNTEPVFGIVIEIGNGGQIRPPERTYPSHR